MVANERRFDVDFRNARIFINQMILKVDMPYFHWCSHPWPGQFFALLILTNLFKIDAISKRLEIEGCGFWGSLANTT